MMTEFKDRLNEGLALRRMSAAELARLSGVNEGAISQYRKGNYKANQYNLDKIAKALNVSIPWLMGADVPITPSIPNASNIFPIERKKDIVSMEQVSRQNRLRKTYTVRRNF